MSLNNQKPAIVKPSKKELKVYNPATRLHLNEDGVSVVLNKYWRRLIKSGDVVVVEKAIKKVKEVKESKEKKSSRNKEVSNTEE